MSEFGWNDPGSAPDGEPRRGLPRVEELRTVDGGYERRSVEEAFDAFYRHAARLDATLRVLESVEAFRRDAAALRDDMRSLRSASWGPVPTARTPWTATAAGGWRAERRGTPDSLLRITVEAALIIAVAVAAGVSGLAVGWVFAIVLAAWAAVGIVEYAISRSTPRAAAPALLPPPRAVEPDAAPAVAAPAPVVAVAPQVGEDTQASELEAVANDEPVDAVEEAAEALAGADAWPGPVEADREEQPEEEELAVEDEAAPAEAADATAEPEQEAEPEANGESEPEPEPIAEASEPEPEPSSPPEAEPFVESWAARSEAATGRRRRLFGRRRGQEPVVKVEPVADPPPNVRVLGEASSDDPWEEPPAVPPEPEAAGVEAPAPGPSPDEVAVPWEADGAAGVEDGVPDQVADADTDARLRLPPPRPRQPSLRRGRR
ncbi:MAG: hypothetical protein ACM33B_04655 [Pseudomonadota bacterium]